MSEELRAALPPGPYRVEWPDEQGGLFTVWGKQGTPPDFADGWAIPLVAKGVEGPMRAICDFLNARVTTLAPGALLPEPEGDGWDTEVRMTKRDLHELLNRHALSRASRPPDRERLREILR